VRAKRAKRAAGHILIEPAVFMTVTHGKGRGPQEGSMLAEIFILWLESLRREPTITTTPSSSVFVPFNRAGFGSFKDGKRRH
jgi:hypothetical protein